MNFLRWVRREPAGVFGWSLVAGGLISLVIGARQVTSAAYLDDQLSYLMSAGVLGLGLIGAGVGLLVSAGLHAEWRTLDAIQSALRDKAGDGAVITLPEETDETDSPRGDARPGSSTPPGLAPHQRIENGRRPSRVAYEEAQ